MPTTKTVRKKKVLKDLGFEHDAGHVALVGPDVGGPANGADYTIALKSSNYSQEIIEKASKVTVTLAIEEFLTRFFGLYYDDAEVLATALGFTTEAAEKEQYDYAEDYRKYIDERVGSIAVMKALNEPNTFADTLANLSGEDYIRYLQDQEQLEKAFNQIEKSNKKESDNEVIASESDTQHGNEEVTKNSRVEKKVEPSGSDDKNKGKRMTQEVDKELIEKAAAMQAELVELQKAKAAAEAEKAEMEALVKSLQAEKQEAITKARTDKVKAAVKTDEDTAVFMKAASALADADFEALVKSLEKMQAVADQSDLFKSLGADGDAKQPDTEGVEKSLQKRIEAKFNKK